MHYSDPFYITRRWSIYPSKGLEPLGLFPSFIETNIMSANIVLGVSVVTLPVKLGDYIKDVENY